jgi:hypothetical protein
MTTNQRNETPGTFHDPSSAISYMTRGGDVAGESRKAFLKARIEAKKVIPGIVRDNTADVPTKSGGKYSYKYVDLPSLQAILETPLADNGLFASFGILPDRNRAGDFVCYYRVEHVEGWVDIVTMPARTEGMTQTGIQAIGSLITYMARYMAAIYWSIPQLDDDGSAASEVAKAAKEIQKRKSSKKGDPKQTAEQLRAQLERMIEQAGTMDQLKLVRASMDRARNVLDKMDMEYLEQIGKARVAEIEEATAIADERKEGDKAALGEIPVLPNDLTEGGKP